MSVIIGRRELFAFAERYSSCRLKDFTDLADGVVLCALFNLVFPNLRVRTASSQTHTLSQRTQANWAALRAALDNVGIPSDLLDQAALLRGDVEKGFSALVLFYFLYHLTRRTDFSAEFAIDVTETLTEFLQSIDSIAALVFGGALPLSAVPQHLQEQISLTMLSRKQRNDQKHHTRHRGRSVSSSSVSSISVNKKRGKDYFERHLSFDSQVGSVGSQSLAEEMAEGTEQPKRQMDGKVRKKEVRCLLGGGVTLMAPGSARRSPVRQASSKTNNNASCATDNCSNKYEQTPEEGCYAHDTSSLRREVELQQALVAKSEECEELKMRGVELLSQLAKLRAELSSNTLSTLSIEKNAVGAKDEIVAGRVEMLEEELKQLRNILQSTREERRNYVLMNSAFAEELLKDIVDAETGEVVNVHETATLLHGVILDALRNSPRRRQEAQKWLWLIVSAYHVIETRLVTACDVAAMEWQRLAGCRSGSSDSNVHGNGICVGTTELLSSTPSTTAKKVNVNNGKSSPSFLLSDAAASVSASCAELLRLEAEMERRQQQFERQLAELHNSEKTLRQRVMQLEEHLHRFSQSTLAREAKWKSLCAVLHNTEQVSFAIAEADTAEEVERLLARRLSLYACADEESAALMQNCAEDITGGGDGDGSGHDVCDAMRALLQSVTEDRDRLQREIVALRKEVLTSAQRLEKQPHASKLKSDICKRLEEQKEYEDDEVWFVRPDARPPFRLNCLPVKQASQSSPTTNSFAEQDTATPFGRNLSALLASVTPTAPTGKA